MNPSPSAASDWQQFRLQTFGDPYLVWHDGADYDALLDRWRTEPELVRNLLLHGLTEGDPLAAQGLEYLQRRGLTHTEITLELERALTTAAGTFRVRVAEALHALTHQQRFADPICDVLLGSGHWAERADAAIALNGFRPTRNVIHALATGVGDREYLVRRHSAQSLLTLAGRHTTIEKLPDTCAKIRSGSAPRARRKAASELTKPWTGRR